ncbi:MAG: hypothetical protein LBB18_04075 [Puniceicoccales bacterium]|jgi:hypothetical protein|nr:hypothetical protein [Puniceicoccales bacterium]
MVAVIMMVAALAWGGLMFRSGKGHSTGESIQKNSPSSKADRAKFLSFDKLKFPWQYEFEGDEIPNFDLFTCPSVTIENENVITKNYGELILDDAFPLYLSAIKDKPYRLKVEGYSQSNDNSRPAKGNTRSAKNAPTNEDSIKTVIMFRDIETNKFAECAVDERSHELKIKVKSFELRESESNGVFFETPVVRIYDDILQKEFELTNEQKFIDGEYVVVIGDPDGNEYALREIGGKVKIRDAECTLRYFSKKDGVAKILLRDADGQEFHKTVHIIY